MAAERGGPEVVAALSWALSLAHVHRRRRLCRRRAPEAELHAPGSHRSAGCGRVCSSEVQHADVYAWGRGDLGQLGLGDVTAYECVPAAVHLLDAKDIVHAAAGDYHTLFLTGDGEVYSTGSNDAGQLGVRSRGGLQAAPTNGADPVDASVLPRDSAAFDADVQAGPVRIEALDVHKVVHLACGQAHSVAVTANGSLASWGLGEYGQLGINGHMSATDKILPRIIKGTASHNFARVSCGANHTLALTGGGDVFSFGQGMFGQLGHGNTDNALSPVHVEGLWGLGIVQVAAGESHSAALTADGLVYTWGRGKYGQLGHGVLTNEMKPMRVDALAGRRVVQIACGGDHTMALTDQSKLYTWGRGRWGQTGHGTQEDWSMPRRLEGLGPGRVKQITAGSRHSLALLEDGSVLGWGDNEQGQLGQSRSLADPRTEQIELLPVKVAGLSMHGTKILFAVAGGENNVAVLQKTLRNTRTEESTSEPMALDEKLDLPQRADDQRQSPKRLNSVGVQIGNLEVVEAGQSSPSTQQDLSPEYENVGPLEIAPSTAPALLVVSGGETEHANGVIVDDEVGSAPMVPLAGSVEASLERTMDLEPDHEGHMLQRTMSKRRTEEDARQDAVVGDGRRELDEHGAGLLPMRLPDLAHLIQKVQLGEAHVAALTHALDDIFASLGYLVHHFQAQSAKAEGEALASEVGLRLDVERIQSTYRSLLELYNPEVITTLSAASARLLNGIEARISRVSEPRTMRALLVLLQSPLIGEKGVGDPTTQRLFTTFTKLTTSAEHTLKQWLGEYPPDTFGGRFIRGALRFMANRRLVLGGREVHSSIKVAVKVLSLLYFTNEAKHLVPYTMFYSSAVSENANLHVPWLLTPVAKSLILHGEAFLEKSQRVQASLVQNALGVQTIPILLIAVRRAELIQDALRQLAANQADLKKPLKVVFDGEEAVDEGGVAKEFFQLLVRDLFNVGYGMFTYNDATRTFWFSQTSMESELEYNLVGIIMGLAIYNGIILDVHFPQVVYKKLVGHEPTLEDLEDSQPIVGRSLRQLLEFTADVEQTFSQTFQVSYEYYGEVRTHDLVPNGGEVMVNNSNREQYVKLYVQYVLTESIATQFDAFSRGFLKVCGGPAFQLFRYEELELLVCGLPHFDFEALQKKAEYQGGFTKDSPQIRWFWEIVQELSLEERKNLLSFVTGNDRAPIGGLGTLRFVIIRHGEDSTRLPTAHTCFNVLMLPEYSSKERMRNRLKVAIQNSTGFGLQ
eukprot:SM000015S01242  [mRNA]  locus=s15:773139:784742:- [translate_table: standard]